MQRHPIRKQRGGFTLIELMLVLSIIGILASLVIPNYKGMVARARATERATIVNDLARVVFEQIGRKGGLPHSVGATTTLATSLNPPLPYTAGLKYWDKNPLTATDWQYIDYAPDGRVRCHYQVTASFQPGVSGTVIVDAYSDLDENNITGQYRKVFSFDAQSLTWTELVPVAPFDSEGHFPVGEN
jgi:prepilin-type N-terminal cleavage/methylation domain-containing protein